MHIFSFLDPIPDRYNSALVCHRWCFLACHPRLWLRVEPSLKCSLEPGVFTTIESAVSAARPGDTILITAGGSHLACDIQIKKPICLRGGGEHPDDTILICSRGTESALEFLSTCKVSNLTVKTKLGCCFLHRRGRLTIQGCLLQCEEHPLDYLSCAIVSTATNFGYVRSDTTKCHRLDCVTVSETRIEGGGAKAVKTTGSLALQHVRAIYTGAAVYFWFKVDEL